MRRRRGGGLVPVRRREEKCECPRPSQRSLERLASDDGVARDTAAREIEHLHLRIRINRERARARAICIVSCACSLRVLKQQPCAAAPLALLLHLLLHLLHYAIVRMRSIYASRYICSARYSMIDIDAHDGLMTFDGHGGGDRDTMARVAIVKKHRFSASGQFGSACAQAGGTSTSMSPP